LLTSLALHLLCTCFALRCTHTHTHTRLVARSWVVAPPPPGFSFLCRYARRAPAAGDCWATLAPLCFSPSFSACLRRVHWCKKIRGLMMRAKNAPRLSRPNRSFLPRQGRDKQARHPPAAAAGGGNGWRRRGGLVAGPRALATRGARAACACMRFMQRIFGPFRGNSSRIIS
jgi:hypothetical protein